MATVSLIQCPNEAGAERLLERLIQLKERGLIAIEDAVIITWSQGTKRPRIRQLTELSAGGALDGAFWGMLFGTVFLMPLAGAAVGAALGLLRGKFADYGINDEIIDHLRHKVTAGTSALFLMSRAAVLDQIVPALKDIPFEITSTNLSREQEDKLRSAFGQEAR